MKVFIQNFCYGKRYPAERQAVHSAEYYALDQVITGERAALNANMFTEDTKRLLCFEELLTSSSAMEEVETFSNTFRLGALLMSEIFMGKALCP